MINRVQDITEKTPVKNVIITVADKSSLEVLVDGLIANCPDVQIHSTGGTYTRLLEILGEKAKEHLSAVAEFTGQPEMQGGLVKTLDFKIYLGLLSEPFNNAHSADIKRVDGLTFDMVVVNLYPFSNSINREDATLEDGRAFIDIGGPCMLRAAAKNFLRVTPVCDPGDYGTVVELLKQNSGSVPFESRFQFASKTFKMTADYDSKISDYLSKMSASTARQYYSFQQ
jgi:phosphoribosylaminoimidazolecarboxamide formyltransferase / IMP cyclohydrolase